ncbi:hypothetical protein ABPG72_003894 [Tetrahymena utriculariae]
MGCCSTKQSRQEKKNTNDAISNSISKKEKNISTIKDKYLEYQHEKQKIDVLNNIEMQNTGNISNKQKHLKNQNSITSFTKMVRKLTIEQNGTQHTVEQEEIYQLPDNFNQILSDRNIVNASYELKISLIGHNSNSNNTKALQYRQMIELNNFSQNEIDQYRNNQINLEVIDFKSVIYSKQFNQFRQYQYFKQKEQKKLPAIKNQEVEESEQIESLMLQKVQESGYDLQECGQQITLLALKNVYQQKGINLIFKQQKESEENEQMNNTMRSYQQEEVQEQNDDYDEIQRHFTQTGFDLETYYQIRLENDADNWNYQCAENDKKGFAKYFKSEIRKKYKNLKDDDITILNIQEGSIIVDFMCPQNIDGIQIGHQIFDKIPVKYIVSELHITGDYFNPKYNIFWENTNKKFYRGNINGQDQQYHLPVGYHGLGLNVLNTGIYPDDGWLNSDTSDATWIVLFHSTYPECVNNILQEGFKVGTRQLYKDSNCRFGRGQVGNGVYFSNKIKKCEEFGGLIQVGDKYYQLIFQCRVNPKTVKSPEQKEEYYVCNNPKDARPYRILIKEYDGNQDNQQQS